MNAQPPLDPLNEGGGRRRFPGVRSFEETDAGQFFGREAVVEELLLRVLSVRLLLQFAPSGVGKTSVLQAGLFPALREHGYFPITVRLNQAEEPLMSAIRRSLGEASTAYGLKDPVIPEDTKSLAELLAATQLWSKDLSLLRPVLVFDQFEEVFTQHDEEFREAFAREIGSLVAARVRTGAAATEALASVKVIISLREEFLGRLEDFSADIPDLFSERLRLVPLSRDEARQAIVSPARLGGTGWASPQFEFESVCLEELLDFIDGSSERYRVIEPLTLQLVCRHAEAQAMANTATGGSQRTIVLADFGGIEGLKKLVSNYYAVEIRKLPDRLSRRRARSMIEQGLLDPAGKRLMLEEGEIQRNHRIARDTLDRLIEGRLLRREPRNESLFYEISHDRLAEAIVHQRPVQLPRWFWRVAAPSVAVLVAMLLVGSALLIKNHQILEATQNAEKAYGLLLGDVLVPRLVEAGSADVLKTVVDSIESRTTGDASMGVPPKASQLRHQGDLLLNTATLGEASQKFEQALVQLTPPSTSTQSESAAVIAERARLVGRLGDIAVDARELALAEQRYDAAQRLWEVILPGTPTPMERLDAAELYKGRAILAQHLGDLAKADEHVAAATQAVVEAWLRSLADPRNDAKNMSFEQGRAMQLLADVTLVGASTWYQEDRILAAATLAQEAWRMRPFSVHALRLVATANTVQAVTMRMKENTALKANDALDEASRRIESLVRFDPEHLRMRREHAAIRLVQAEQAATRMEAKGQSKAKSPQALNHARAEALEATGDLRWLASRDPQNKSIREDVGWALTVSARLQAAAAQGDDSIDLLDAALVEYRAARGSRGDYLNQTAAADVLMRKANLLAGRNEADRAKAAMEDAEREVETLPATFAGTVMYRSVLADRQDEVLRDLRLPRKAGRVAAGESERLNETIELKTLRNQNARLANEQAVYLSRTAADLAPDAEMKTRREAAIFYLQAIKDRPSQTQYWENLSHAMGWIVVAFDRSPADAQPAATRRASVATLVGDMTASRESALRFRAATAAVAHALSHSDEERKTRNHEMLYQARRDLAIHLRDHDKEPMAQTLARDGLFQARELLAGGPLSAQALEELRDAYYGVGLTRFESHTDGWEEPLRLAAQHAQQLVLAAPADSGKHLMWLATIQADLGNKLLEKGQKEASKAAFRSAVATCGNVLAKGSPADEVKKQCLERVPVEFR